METDKKSLRDEALAYHAEGRPGKIEVIPTKPYSTQKDLSLAYSPGVAEPCLEIEKNPDNAYKYTDKGNLVAVISNGTAAPGQSSSRSSSASLTSSVAPAFCSSSTLPQP